MRKEDCSLHIQTIVNGKTIMHYEIWHILAQSKSTNTKIDNENIRDENITEYTDRPNLSKRSEHNSSNFARVRVASICLGPSAVAVMKGRLHTHETQTTVNTSTV